MSTLGMGGYGVYVWAAFGITAFAILVEILLLRGRVRAARATARETPRIDDELDVVGNGKSSRARLNPAGGSR
jgi:heme exporter protein CcmD